MLQKLDSEPQLKVSGNAHGAEEVERGIDYIDMCRKSEIKAFALMDTINLIC